MKWTWRWLLALVAIVGCDGAPPGRAPQIEVKLEGLFEELGGANANAGEGAKEGGALEAAWDEVAAEGVAEDEVASAAAMQKVIVGQEFAGDLPTDDWRAASLGRHTLVVHQLPGAESPDAVIYVQAFAPDTRRRRAYDALEFAGQVDPVGFSQAQRGAMGIGLLAKFGSEPGIDLDRLTRCVAKLGSPTGARGLGFRVGEEGKTGMRWIGGSDEGVYHRLARYEGTWSSEASYVSCSSTYTRMVMVLERDLGGMMPAPMQESMGGGASSSPFGALDRVMQEFEAADHEAQLAQGASSDGGEARRGAPAQVLIGSVSLARNQSVGADVAILCRATPSCAQAPVIEEFLQKLHVPDGGERAMAVGGSDEPTTFRELAGTLGVVWREPQDLMGAELLQGLSAGAGAGFAEPASDTVQGSPRELDEVLELVPTPVGGVAPVDDL